MAEDQDPESKTEQPTPKRLEEAQKKGNIPVSREVGNFFVLALLALVISWSAPNMLRDTLRLLSPLLSNAADLPADEKTLSELFMRLTLGSIGIAAVPLFGAMAAAIAAGIIQNGLVISSQPIMPQWTRLSPLSGFKRIFSVKSVVELLKNLIKITLVGYVGFVSVYPELARLAQLPGEAPDGMLVFLLLLTVRLTMGVAVAMFLIAILDTAYQRFQYIKSLRMTRQEIKDEYKQSEGDPIIKQRLRRLRQERAKKRMMGNVATSDVVITNPTHFSVALKYDSQNMRAPTLVAKGQDLVALRIRELAKENDVPIVENPPLARALFASVDLEEEIPTEHYEAVAKVISYVYQLKGRRPR